MRIGLREGRLIGLCRRPIFMEQPPEFLDHFLVMLNIYASGARTATAARSRSSARARTAAATDRTSRAARFAVSGCVTRQIISQDQIKKTNRKSEYDTTFPNFRVSGVTENDSNYQKCKPSAVTLISTRHALVRISACTGRGVGSASLLLSRLSTGLPLHITNRRKR